VLTAGETLPPLDLVAEGLLRGPERRAILRWPWKLDVRQGPGRVLLFDLERDPGETRNLARERPELVAELRSALDARTGAEAAMPPPTRVAPIDDATRERLVGLGYAE
jgi:arylsulfatase A-like enzyme